MDRLSNEDRYNKGKEFQIFAKALLADTGYLEGQLYSTTGKFDPHYADLLKRLNKPSYTSPDITVLNSWDHPEKGLDRRFGIACSRRDATFERYNHPAVTFPRYQRHALSAIEDEIGLPIYIMFGRSIGRSSFALGVTELQEPDETMNLTDHSTGNPRWTDIYYIENLWNYETFVENRIGFGDKEPDLKVARKLAVPFLS